MSTRPKTTPSELTNAIMDSTVGLVASWFLRPTPWNRVALFALALAVWIYIGASVIMTVQSITG